MAFESSANEALYRKSGVVVFSARFQHSTGFMAPVWRMSSGGAESLSGCCAFATLDAVLGANDPDLHSARAVPVAPKLFERHRNRLQRISVWRSEVYFFVGAPLISSAFASSTKVSPA